MLTKDDEMERLRPTDEKQTAGLQERGSSTLIELSMPTFSTEEYNNLPEHEASLFTQGFIEF